MKSSNRWAAAVVLIHASAVTAQTAWTTCRLDTCTPTCRADGQGNPSTCGPQCCLFSRKEKQLRTCIPHTCGENCSRTDGHLNSRTCGPRCCQRFWWFKRDLRLPSERRARPLSTLQDMSKGNRRLPPNMRYDNERYPGVLLSRATEDHHTRLAAQAKPRQMVKEVDTWPRQQLRRAKGLAEGVLTFNVCGGLTNQRLAIIDGSPRHHPFPPMHVLALDRTHPCAPPVWQGSCWRPC